MVKSKLIRDIGCIMSSSICLRSLIQCLHDRHEKLFKRLKEEKKQEVIHLDGAMDPKEVCAEAFAFCKSFRGTFKRFLMHCDVNV